MKINSSPKDFLNSITGLSAITGVTLVLLRRYELAAAIFAALVAGSVGVSWDRYSTKAGSPLQISSFKKKRSLDEDEISFITTHAPYVFLAAISYLLSRKTSKK